MNKFCQINLHGYEDMDEDLLKLQQVSITATPEVLMNLAQFIKECAESMSSEKEFDHRHFLDFMKCYDNFPDIVILAEKKQ